MNIVAALAFILLMVQPVFSQETGKARFTLEFSGIGELILEQHLFENDNQENTQLVLKRPGGMREIIDTVEGLLPADLRKFDLDADSSPEIIALLRHPDGIDVMPYIYRLQETFVRAYPDAQNPDATGLICREIVLTADEKNPLLCAKNIVSFHDFGPPYLYQLEFFRLTRQGLELFNRSFSEGDHFNILMNRGAMAFNDAKYLEAIEFYEQAVSSSTGEITTKAFIESLFNMAEARKLSKDFKSSLELFQKIVMEFGQNHRTDAAQKEIELISAGLEKPEVLSYLTDASIMLNSNKWEEALALVENRPVGALEDHFLFLKAEILTAQNRIDEAVKVFNELKTRFPESMLLEEVDQMLEDMQGDPEESEGL
ncbi:MAG: tetratricopeptide repeat protein [Candidatus Riflebacteria bacterium]